MADNVTLAQGQLTVATQGDAAGIQHQKVAAEFVSSNRDPVLVATTTPLPVSNDAHTELFFNILVELRVLTELIYALAWSEAEPIEALRAKYKDFPVTPA